MLSVEHTSLWIHSALKHAYCVSASCQARGLSFLVDHVQFCFIYCCLILFGLFVLFVFFSFVVVLFRIWFKHESFVQGDWMSCSQYLASNSKWERKKDDCFSQIAGDF